MTEKLDLAEEIAALRRAVAAQAVMLKAAMEAVERPHDTLKALDLRLKVLENWQLDVNATLMGMNAPASPPPSSNATYAPANDNTPDGSLPKARASIMMLLAGLEAIIRYHKQRMIPGGNGGLVMDLEQFVDRHRRD